MFFKHKLCCPRYINYTSANPELFTKATAETDTVQYRDWAFDSSIFFLTQVLSGIKNMAQFHFLTVGLQELPHRSLQRIRWTNDL